MRRYIDSPAAAPAMRTTTTSTAAMLAAVFMESSPVVRIDAVSVGPPVEVVLQDDRGRRRIEARLALPPVALANGETTLGVATREALVLFDDRKAGAVSQGAD